MHFLQQNLDYLNLLIPFVLIFVNCFSRGTLFSSNFSKVLALSYLHLIFLFLTSINSVVLYIFSFLISEVLACFFLLIISYEVYNIISLFKELILGFVYFLYKSVPSVLLSSVFYYFFPLITCV